MLDVTPSPVSIGLFVVGWTCGWLLLCCPRRLARASGSDRPSVAVIVPARNEAAVIATLVASFRSQLGDGDELVVVDDHSTDGTAALAAAAGARVVVPPALPVGWRGKPHACWFGVGHTSAPVLVFVDADLAPSATLLDDLVAELERAPVDSLVSVQPWHRVERPSEQLSLIFNLLALMGVGTFGALRRWGSAMVAFGPVVACRRDVYLRVGGHAHPDVRRLVTEDIGLARLFGTRRLFVGAASGSSFRMYPNGVRDVVDGWTKSIAYGMSSVRPLVALPTIAWVWSVVGGWLVSPWFFIATAVQLAVLGRIAGSFRRWICVLHPIATLTFLIVVARSAWRTARRLPTAWRGRDAVAR